MSTDYVARNGEYPYIPYVKDTIQEVPISSEIGIFEASEDEGPVIGRELFPYFSHLQLSQLPSLPYPDGLMIAKSGQDYPYFVHVKDYIPTLKREYPNGIMISKKGENYPFYNHLELVPVDFNIIYSNLKFNKEYAHDVSYNKNHINKLHFNGKNIFSFYPNGDDFNYEEYSDKIMSFIDSDNLLFTEGGVAE